MSKDRKSRKSQCGGLIVAAIDFGTTFSGYAFSFLDDYQADRLRIYANTSWQSSGEGHLSWKTPTTLLLNEDYKFEAFGYEAEEEYNELIDNDEHRSYHYFRRFKMMLYNKKIVNRDVSVEDSGGREYPARDVFALSINYLKEHLLSTLKERDLNINPDEDIQWVLTLPAIWNEPAKQFMREAATKAGIPKEHLILALEPEAASLYCKYLPTERIELDGGSTIVPFSIGTRYMVLDLGGGTVDVTVHEVQDENTLREIHKASGGAWGGTTVDEAYFKIVTEIFGQETISKFRNQRRTEMLEFQRDFETKKRMVREVKVGTRQKPVVISIPAILSEFYSEITGKTLREAVENSPYRDTIHMKPGNKLGLDRDLLEGMFSESKSGIIKHVKHILSTKGVGEQISAILMVGGFSTSKIITDAVREAFPKMRIVVPQDAGLAVVKGAVLYGHAPLSIASRVCKYTYGVAIVDNFDPKRHPENQKYIENGEELCKNVFDKFIEIGSSVKAEEQIHRTYDVMKPDRSMDIQIFASESPNPVLTTDADYHLLGKISIAKPENGWCKGAKVNVKMEFGGTEFRVYAEDTKNESNRYETTFDFLANVSNV